MVVLYSSGGSRELIIDDEAMPHPAWDKLKATVLRLLRARQQTQAAELLDTIPFMLMDGHNGFYDEFLVLRWSANIERDVEVADWAQDRAKRSACEQIAKAVSEIIQYVRFIVVEPDVESGVEAVPTPRLKTTSEFVERALNDAEALITNTGATSGVDRAHSALHGFLEDVCKEKAIAHHDDASITQLLTVIKREHPALADTPERGKVLTILRGFGGIVDTLNPLRNSQSMAHPTNELLGEAEAMLVINAVRTLLHYFDAKLR